MQFHGNTAVGIIYNRADHKKEYMGLTSWKGDTNGKIHKYDVVIAKNYLSETETGYTKELYEEAKERRKEKITHIIKAYKKST